MNTPRKTSLLLLALLTSLTFSLGAVLRTAHRTLAQEAPEPVPSFTPPASVAAGTTIQIDGSTSMAVINQALEQGFEQRYAGTDVVLSSSGTDTALQTLLQGNLELAAVGRPLSDEEKAQGLTQVPISREKIAIIVGQNNPFQGDLTFDSFAKIFRGEITNWSQLGGPNLALRFVDRPTSSDTRQALSGYEVFRNGTFDAGANAVPMETDDTAAVVRALGSDGISYAIASQVLNQDNVRVVTMHSTLPDDPRYPYSQPRGYVYRGEPSIPVEAFLGFATNPDGQQAVAEAKADEAATVATAELLPGLIAVSPDGQLMVRGTQDGRLEWYDGQGNALGITVPAHTGLVTGLLFAPDGQSLISSSADGTIRRWDLQGNPVGQPMQGSDGPITALALSPDGQQIVSGNNDGTVQKWSAAGQALGSPLQAHPGTVRAIAFGPDGKLTTASNDANVRLWNPDGSAAGAVASGHQGGVTALATSPDAQFMVSGGADGSLQFWDAAGTPRGNLIPAHSAGVTSLAVSPGGQTIASAGKDNLFRLWDANGNPKTVADNQLPGPASDLAFKPDGELVTSLADGDLQLRNAEGQIASGDLPTLPANAKFNLPPEITNALQGLPRSTWWIIPAIPILLILAGLLWSLFGGRKAPLEEDETFDLEAGEALDEPLTVPVEGSLDGSSGSSYGPDPGLPPESAWVGIDPGATEDLGLGDKLGQAKVDLAEGTRLAREGRYDDALNHFNSAIEAADVERMKAIAVGASLGGITWVLAQAMAHRGEVLATLGRSDRALESFNRALEMDATSVEAWIGKGHLLASTGQTDEALFCFDQALELDPNSAPAWAGKGRVLVQMGRQQEGQTCLNRATELGVGETSLPIPTPTPVPEGLEPLTPSDPRPGPVDPSIVAMDEGDVPPDLAAITAGLPTAEEPLEPGILLGDPEVPEAMQAVVAALPDAPEAPEDAFVTADQITNPDDLDQGVAPAALMAPPLTLPAVASAPIAAVAAPLVLDEISLPAPEDLDEMTEALQATVDLSGIGTLPPSPSPDPVAPLPATVLAEASGRGDLVVMPSPTADPVAVESPETLHNPRAMGAAVDNPDALATAPLDNPDFDSSLADLPPEVLAALRGIPSDSPDHLPLPEPAPGRVPPAVPANPRLSQLLPEDPGDLPTSWMTLSVQPEDDRLYAVWEITDWERAAAQQGGGESMNIRLYDVTGGSAAGTLPLPVDEQECYELAQDWYLKLPQRNRTYVAEIGYQTGSQDWLSLARSNTLSV